MRKSILARKPRPILASLAILAAALLACSGPGWVAGSEPTPLPEPSPTAQAARVEAPKPAETQETGPILETVIAYQSLNARQSASEKSASLSILYHGEQVELTGKCSETAPGWAEIRFKDGRGGLAWVNSRYVSGEHCKERE